ncbi:MAG: formate--tetrahydrofolate ligase, partial [Sutterellaceae bacterium]|nr:formate--tetrahydrofolate ligase [Sutterellaceae bacterium]
YAYDADAPILEKLQGVITRCYGASGFELSAKAQKDLKQIEDWGFGHLPICVAKTPLSLSHDPKLLGAPKNFTIPVERMILNAGAGFVVITTGSILRMPGLPKAPNAFKIDVVNGEIVGLS